MVKGLDKPPILMGHSAGGVFVQLLLDRGYGASGVVFNSAPTEGVLVAPLSQLKATFPVLAHPGKKSVGFTHAQWHYAFTNTFADDESQRLYKRYHIPASGEIFWESVLANVKPGHQETWVDYSNDNRAPLLFVSGGADNLMPPSVQRSNAKHYQSNTITEVKEYAGFAHLLPAQDGWERIADEALDWAEQHARVPVGGHELTIRLSSWERRACLVTSIRVASYRRARTRRRSIIRSITHAPGQRRESVDTEVVDQARRVDVYIRDQCYSMDQTLRIQ